MEVLVKYRGLVLAAEIIVALELLLLIISRLDSWWLLLPGGLLLVIIIARHLLYVRIGQVMIVANPMNEGIALLTRGPQAIPIPLHKGPVLSTLPENYVITHEVQTSRPGVRIEVELAIGHEQIIPQPGDREWDKLFRMCRVKGYKASLWHEWRELRLKSAINEAVAEFTVGEVLGQSRAFRARLVELASTRLAEIGARLAEVYTILPRLAASSKRLEDSYVYTSGEMEKEAVIRYRADTLSQMISQLGPSLNPQEVAMVYSILNNSDTDGGSDKMTRLWMLNQMFNHSPVQPDAAPSQDARARVIDINRVKRDNGAA